MALIELADTLGCSIRGISKIIDRDEFELRLVYHLVKLGYTSDQVKIKKQATQDFLQTARKANWGN